MSVSKTFHKKPWLFCLSIVLFLFCVMSAVYYFTSDARQFAKLTQKLFQSELSGDTLSLHYTIAYPENYDLEGETVLPVYSGSIDASKEQKLLQDTIKSAFWNFKKASHSSGRLYL